MVIEVKSIKGSFKGLQYQADDKGLSKEILRSDILVGNEPKEWHKQMQKTEDNNKRVENKRFSIVISPSKEVSKNLTNNDWKNLVNNYFDKMGINPSNYKFISHLHTSTDDPHLHITLSRIPILDEKYKFTALNDNQIGIKSGNIADKIAKENGWRTAKEIAKEKRDSIAQSLRVVLRNAKNFNELTQAMKTHGFVVQLSQNDAKGIYGMRIIPISDINENPSIRSQNSKQGYKLSEIERSIDRKAKFRISDVKIAFERNMFKQMSPQERLIFAKEKEERIFSKDISDSPKTTIIESNNLEQNKSKNEGILEHFLKENYSSPPQEDMMKKKKKKKR